MAKVSLSDLANLSNPTAAKALINSNSTAIENAFENTLSLDGTAPNQMLADLDMNSNNILNLPYPASSTEPVRLGDVTNLLPRWIAQNDTPATTFVEGSLWLDTDSTDLDVYQLTAGTWVDTNVNLRGTTGATGAPGTNGTDGDDGGLLFVQNSAPSTSNPESSLWIDADSGQNDLYQLTGGVWVDTGVNLKGADGAGTGDVVGPSSSVDGEIALFSLTTGKLLKRASTTGLLKATSGVLAAAVAGTDYVSPDPTLAALAAYNTNGILTQTSADVFVGRTITGTANQIDVTNGNGVSGNPTLSLPTVVNPVGKRPIYIPAAAMVPRTTNGAALNTIELTTNKQMIRSLDFDTTTQEFAQFSIRMPKAWNESTVTFVPVWSHASTTTNFGVVWALEALAVSNDDALDAAWGTAGTSTDTGGTTNDLYEGPESSAITIAGTPAEGDTVYYQIKRNVSDGADTLAIDARLHGILLYITTNAATDA